ncbi:MAG TPA: hypothetical protein DIW36_08480 [Ruminococcaceae bacterium]|nr:hypothetical protein [Oscillospiraceae bacterium]
MELVKVEGFEHIYQIDRFEKEFTDIADGDIRYKKWLIRSLEMLESMGMAALKLENFEMVSKDDPKIYSIRYPHSKLNPRVLYIYVDRDGACLLTAFKESSKNRSSDYEHAINRARGRLKYVLD